MAPPTALDTHCQGAGLRPSTSVWGTLKRRYRQFENFGLDASPSLGTPRSLPPRVDLTGKNVLISGANSGIGLEAAFIFVLWGASKVVLACRPQAPPHEMKPEQARTHIQDRVRDHLRKQGGAPEERATSGLGDDRIEVWDVDFGSFKSIEALGKRWLETGWTLDVLCNNAGLSSPRYIVTEDGHELTRSVNYLGHCLLTLIVLPAMKKARAPRIVNTCSCFHFNGTLDFANMEYEKSKGQERGPGGVQAYCDTKLQHVMWSFELQERLSRSDEYRHVIVNGVHPGVRIVIGWTEINEFISSNIWNNPDFKDLGWPKPQIVAALVSRLSVSTEQGALCILYGALHPKYGLRPSQTDAEFPNAYKSLPKGTSADRGGHYISRDEAQPARPECYDMLARSRLWQRTLEDIKADERGLTKALPGHYPDVL